MMSNAHAVKTEGFPFCHGCFSIDRRLHHITDYADIFTKLLDMRYADLLLSECLFCWECRAELRRISNFKFKVNKAQNYMNSYDSINLQPPIPAPMTRITTSMIKTTDQTFKQPEGSTENNAFFSDAEENLCFLLVKVENDNHDTENDSQETENDNQVTFENLNRDCTQGNEDVLDLKEEIFQDCHVEELPLIDCHVEELPLIDCHVEELPLIEKKEYQIKTRTAFKEMKRIAKEIKKAEKARRKQERKQKKLEENEEVPLILRKKVITPIKEDVDDNVNNDDEDWLSKGVSESMRKRLEGELEEMNHQKFNILTSKDKGKLYKAVSVGNDELQYWLERDRKDESFLKLPYRCEACVFGSMTEEGLDKHMKKLHSKRHTNTCYTCLTTHKTAAALDAHMERHKLLCCRVCNFRSAVRRHMAAHLTVHERAVKCNECGMCFRNQKPFREHWRKLHLKFVCHECGRSKCSKRVLIAHMRLHETPTCKICNKTYGNRKSLESHNVLQHRAISNSELAYCVECDKQFPSELAYQRHLKATFIHLSDKIKDNHVKVPCPSCDKSYMRKQYMLNHYRLVHLNKTKYYCDICEKYFLTRTRYRDHVNYKHKGLKPVKNKPCPTCGRKFSTNRMVQKHLRTHTGERPFACEHCHAKFTQAESLASHVRHIHLKVKRNPYCPPNIHTNKEFE